MSIYDEYSLKNWLMKGYSRFGDTFMMRFYQSQSKYKYDIYYVLFGTHIYYSSVNSMDDALRVCRYLRVRNREVTYISVRPVFCKSNHLIGVPRYGQLDLFI